MNISRLCSEAARRGFTLIELLTVIAIIGILAAILIPTVGKVRAQAKNAQCLSNVRQLGQAVLLFSDANRGQLLPWGQTSTFQQWHLQIEGFLGNQKTDTFNLVSNPVLTCPTAEVAPNPNRSSYGANPNVMPDGKSTTKKQISRTQILRPSQTVLLTDSGTDVGGNAVWGFWQQTDVAAGGVDDADKAIPDSATGSTSGAVIRWRHDGRASFAFADGHAATIKLGDLQQRHLQIKY